MQEGEGPRAQEGVCGELGILRGERGAKYFFSGPKRPLERGPFKSGGRGYLGEGRLGLPGQVWELRFLPSFPSFSRETRSSNISGKTPGSPRHPSSRHPRPSHTKRFLKDKLSAQQLSAGRMCIRRKRSCKLVSYLMPSPPRQGSSKLWEDLNGRTSAIGAQCADTELQLPSNVYNISIQK